MQIQKSTLTLLVASLALTGCVIAPPSMSTSMDDPSNPRAAEAVTPPLRPGLVKGAKTYLSPPTGAEEKP